MGQVVPVAEALRADAGARLARRGSLRIALLSDLGFEYGAGVALRRQAQSLLLDGHSVGVVCGGTLRDGEVVAAPDPGAAALAPRGRALRGEWLGVRSATESVERSASRPRRCDPAVLAMVSELAPDLVIAGNLHWAGWSVSLLEALTRRGVATVAYMHDLHSITGRCAQPYGCAKYLDGCDETCPTATEYPALRKDLIAEEWMLRRRVFVESRVPLVGNSAWTAAAADAAFGGRAPVARIHLGLDTGLFSPIDRALARRLLGLDDRPTVLFGAVDALHPEKGGAVVRQIVDMLAREDIAFVAFGHGSQSIPRVRGIGYITDERLMPVLYGACDCFLTMSTVESFGQTVLEAAACARPVVTLRGGGIVDIARDGVNGRTFAELNLVEIVGAIRAIVGDPGLRDRFGEAGRTIATAEFSLERQAASWREWIGGSREEAAHE
jgi:glycosyltransferase involved in cell wall biosynthesis